jgi:shikimate dehydrogenase
VATALLDAGVPALRLANRTRERAATLAEELRSTFAAPVEIIPWEGRAAALDGAALLVNTTSLGMAGQPPLEVALDVLPASAVVADIVYVPLETDLLARARARGNAVVDGLGMLLHQAVPGFAHWGGIEPEADAAARSLLLEALARR